jgi:hypothetical protein
MARDGGSLSIGPDSTKSSVCYLRDKACTRATGDASPGEPASNQYKFLALGSLLFLLRKLSVGLQDHSKGILQILACLLDRFALSIHAGYFLNPGSPPIIDFLKRGGQLHAVTLIRRFPICPPFNQSQITNHFSLPNACTGLYSKDFFFRLFEVERS